MTTTQAAAVADGKSQEEVDAWCSSNRYNELMAPPAEPTCAVCVVQFRVPGAKNGGTDKGPDGNRIDSIPIANGCIKAGAATTMYLFDADAAEKSFEELKALAVDAYIVRINPGQLSQGTPEGTQAKFDAFMNAEQAFLAAW